MSLTSSASQFPTSAYPSRFTHAGWRFLSFFFLLLTTFGTTPGHSQGAASDTILVEIVRPSRLDTIATTLVPTAPSNKRLFTIAGLHAVAYAGTLAVLNQAWYKNYDHTGFHTFNDNAEWLQIDKVGHAWSAYQLGRASMPSWKWAGQSPQNQTILGGLSGFSLLTIIEVLDAFNAKWGWSWGDIAANTFGSGMLIGQQLAWHEQRISFKYSFHAMTYSDAMLSSRSAELFGSSAAEKMLKDYNGQTYWLSTNLKSFFKQSKLPPWLNIAVGYGASGMFEGRQNIWTDGDTGFPINRTDINRVRQWYLSPDIDFTRIRTRSKLLKSVFFCLNAFKLPAPTLVLSKGKLAVHAAYF